MNMPEALSMIPGILDYLATLDNKLISIQDSLNELNGKIVHRCKYCQNISTILIDGVCTLCNYKGLR